MMKYVDLLISWGPTVLFILTILIASYTGYKRGFRKSLILMIHSIIAGVLSLSLYLVCVNVKAFDKLLLDVTNLILGYPDALESLIGVNASCETLKEVLVEAIPMWFSFDNAIYIILKDNGAYLGTLVNLAYHIVFGLLFSITYFINIFILYIIYCCCYSEKKYKAKKEEEFALKQDDSSYKKRSLYGLLIGFCRGFVAAIISISFLGSTFYIVAGGTGEGEMPEYSFGDKNADNVYTAYRSIEKYGTQGIFKVLNTVKDVNDAPYYLFAADLIFSGNLEDPDNNIKQNIKFREELAAYTGFARETVSLLMEYGGDELRPVILGQSSEDPMTVIVGVMSDEKFQEDFKHLIEDFDSKTYVINLALSLVDTIICNIDEMGMNEFVGGEDVAELLKVLFKKGHLSTMIPEERKLLERNQKREFPHINVSHLLEKRDVSLILDVVLDFLNPENLQQETLFDTIREIIPSVKKLSILSDRRKEELNGVFGRLYCYLENRYLTYEGTDGLSYSDVKDENVDWIYEIKSVVDFADDVYELVDNVYLSNYYEEGEEPNVLDVILSVFDPEEESYSENMVLYDRALEKMVDSKLLGKVLASNLVSVGLEEAIVAINPDSAMPEKIQYEEKYDKDGNLVAHGELYNFLYGVRYLGSPDNKEILDIIFPSDGSEEEIIENNDSNDENNDESNEENNFNDLLDFIADSVDKTDDKGNTLVDYFMDSHLLRSVVSSFIISASNSADDFILYIPEVSLETNSEGDKVNIINKKELKEILVEIPEILDLLEPIINDGDFSRLNDVVSSNVVNGLVYGNNRIVEGTIANMFINYLGSDNGGYVVIPNKLQNAENWLSTDKRDGEVKRIINFVNDSNVDIASLVSGNNSLDLFNTLNSLNDQLIDELFRSEVLHYTISNYISSSSSFGDFEFIVPASAVNTLKNDVIDELILKDQLVTLFKEITHLGLINNDDGPRIEEILKILAEDKDTILRNDIISVSVINTLINADSSNNLNISNFISIPDSYLEAASEMNLKSYSMTNVWRDELPNLINALDEVLDLSVEGSDVQFTQEYFDKKISDLTRTFNDDSRINPSKTRLQVCSNSKIILNELTTVIETNFGTGTEYDYIIENAKDKDGTFRPEEFQAIGDFLDIFGVQLIVNNFNPDEVISKIESDLTSLNVKYTSGRHEGKTKLEVIYPSSIISGIFSKQIDDILAGHINNDLLMEIKFNGTIYPQNEVRDLINSISALNYSNFDDMQELFTDAKNTLSLFKDEQKLNAVYNSNITSGVLTSAIDEVINSTDLLSTHPLAYKENIKIYRIQEVQALIEFLDRTGIELSSLDIDDIDILLLKEFVYNNRMETSSYILVATLSKNIFNIDDFVIPNEILDSRTDKLISPSELGRLLTASYEMLEGGSVGKIKDEIDINSIPDRHVVSTMLHSVILRASISNKIISSNINQKLYISKDLVEIDKDNKTNDKIAILNVEELELIFEGLRSLNDDDGLNISLGSANSILKLNNSVFNSIVESELLRNIVAIKLAESNFASLFPSPTESMLYNLHKYKEESQSIYDKQQLLDIKNQFANL